MMDGEKIMTMWVRIAFSQDSIYGISNCYARISVPFDAFLRASADRFLLLEDVVLPISSGEDDRKRSTTISESNLTPMKNLQKAFPGSLGKLYVNTFQIKSIMPIDQKSDIAMMLERITNISVVDNAKKD